MHASAIHRSSLRMLQRFAVKNRPLTISRTPKAVFRCSMSTKVVRSTPRSLSFCSPIVQEERFRVQRKFSDGNMGEKEQEKKEISDEALETALRRRPVLSSLVELHLLETLDEQDIRKMWLEKHKNVKCLSATVEARTYSRLKSRGKNCPRFIVPLPQKEGFLMMFIEIQDDAWMFTTLDDYREQGEHALPLCTLHYYTEVMDSKGLVLMRGEVNHNRLPLENAQFMAHQVQIFYLDNDKYDQWVKTFNFRPNEFDVQGLVKEMDNLSL